MTTRVTQSMLNIQLLTNLSRNYNRMGQLENQLATGRQLNKPSDNPVAISFAMRYRSQISENDQYVKNADAAMSWLQYTDSSMEQANSIFSRARELIVQGLHAPQPQQALDAIAAEIRQLHDQLVLVGNGKYNGKFVFNGQMTDKQPYSTENAEKAVTDPYVINYEIGVGMKLPISTTGNVVFGAKEQNDNAFNVLTKTAEALEKGDRDSLQTALGNLDSRYAKFMDIRADIGAKMNRLELSQQRLKDLGTNVTELLSKTEDADMAEVMTKMKMDQNVYEASLATGSKLIKQTLVDFLR